MYTSQCTMLTNPTQVYLATVTLGKLFVWCVCVCVQVVVSGFYRSAQGRSCLRADSCLYNGESVVSLYIDCSDLTSYKIWCKGHACTVLLYKV